MRNRAMGLLPDLGAGADIVRHRVIRVVELVQHGALALCLHLQRQITRTFHAFFLADQNQFRAIGFHCGAALFAHILRHHQNHAIAHYRRGHGQGDAGITTGSLDQGIAGPDFSAFLRLCDHIQRRAVLDRTGGIIALQLQQNGITAVIIQALQLNQRRITDSIG